jgi:hypothetical protein
MLRKNIMTLVVTKNEADANAGGLIVNDCTHSITDRNGELVWYLANVNWKLTQVRSSRSGAAVNKTTKSLGMRTAPARLEIRPMIYDLKLTPYGTITYLEESYTSIRDSIGQIVPLERDLAGNILWTAPNNDKFSESAGAFYNHDFKRLPNGNYMVLGNEEWRKLPGYHDTEAVKKKYGEIQTYGGQDYGRVEFGTVIEYDKKGNEVWSWNSNQYFDSDALKPIGNPKLNFLLRPHVNAFGVDRKNEFVYVGFRDVSRIVKIEKATGKVVDSWGTASPQTEAQQTVNFHHQHGANILDDGTIAIFNDNDFPGRDSVPGAIIFSQQPTDTGNIVWRFDYDFEKFNRRATRTGGNVDQLNNGNLLVCLGDIDKIMEVTRDKKIVWEAEIKANEKRSFSYFHRLYRSHYVSSLYPCYFIFETSRDTVKRKSADFNIRLFNKGSENDAYHVKIVSSSGTFSKQFSIDTLAPNRSTTFNIDAGKQLHNHEKIEITITSKTNPDFERKKWVTVQ